MNDLITQYILSRGLVEPGSDPSRDILENEGLLAEIAGIWEGHKGAIEALVKARIHPIERELVAQATPAEVIILRQAMVEIAFFYDDFARYAAEYARRKAEAGSEGAKPEPEPPPEPEEDSSSV